MAVTKILARKGGLSDAIRYVVNSDKTNGQTLTAYLNCDPGHAARQMQDTKENLKKTDGVQYYHMILSFKPGEVTAELALQIAKEFAKEHLPGFETVISVHVDRKHVHAHLLWNSVNADTGEKSIIATIGATIDRFAPSATGQRQNDAGGVHPWALVA